MSLGKAVAGLTIDPRLGPGGVIGVGLEVIVGGELTDMAAIAGGVEGVGPLLPVHRFPARGAGEMPHAACCRVEPFLLADIIGDGQDLKPTPLQRSQEILDILSPEGVFHRIFFVPLRTLFDYPTGFASDIGAIAILADEDRICLRSELLAGKLGRVGLHGQAVMGGRPELIELFVAFPAARRARKGRP